MSGIDLNSTPPGTQFALSVGISEPLEGLVVTNPLVARPTAADPDSRPTVRIAKRSSIRPWKNPRRLDPLMFGSSLVIGKARGLFVREPHLRFWGNAAKARRAAEQLPAAPKTRRWEPVVISPVFPRGPLELPASGFLRAAKRRSIKTCRARLVRRNRSRRPDQVA